MGVNHLFWYFQLFVSLFMIYFHQHLPILFLLVFFFLFVFYTFYLFSSQKETYVEQVGACENLNSEIVFLRQALSALKLNFKPYK